MKKIANVFNALFLLAVQYSCHNPDTNAGKALLQEGKVDNQGVSIAYDDTKLGDTTLLFVHGWDINRTYWANQVEFFSKRYRVIAMDLPGFGASGKNRKDWTVEEYAKDIAAILERADLHNVILIGHSMSGAIVVEAAERNPARVIGVVGIDNFTNFGTILSPEVEKDMADAYKALRTHYKEVAVQYANQSLFAPSTNSTVRKRVINDFVNADSEAAINILETNDRYPLDERVKSLGKILYLINSNYHETDTSNFKKYNVPFKLFYVGPTGHYPMIESPDEFNRKLEDVILEISRKDAKK